MPDPGGYTGDPAESDTDKVRLYVGDTDTPPLLSDDEIQWMLDSNEGVPIRAGYAACLFLAAKFSRKVNVFVGPTRIYYTELVTSFKALAADLARQGGAVGITMDPGAPLADNMDDRMETAAFWRDVR